MNLDPFNQVLKTFGVDNLQRASAKAVEILALPDRAKEFLVTVGLPKRPVLLCKFYLEADRIPSLAEYAREKNLFVQDVDHLRRIGTDDMDEICIDESRNGEVWTYGLPPRMGS